MCRFLFYTGTPVLLHDLLFEPAHSLILQSVHSSEREEPLNGDGFGIAWYVPNVPVPGLFRSISPAWSNQNLQSLSRVVKSPCVMAHVRAASDGLAVVEGNCHPFVFENISFMHNGDLAGFTLQRRALLAKLSDQAFATLQGYTDSEFLFAVWLDCYWASDKSLPPVVRMAEALQRAMRNVLAWTHADQNDPGSSYFNVVVTDGQRSVACRCTNNEPRFAESLHLHTGGVYRVIDGACRMVPPTDNQGAVIISSEALSDDPGWLVVPPNHVVSVDEHRATQVREVALSIQ